MSRRHTQEPLVQNTVVDPHVQDTLANYGARFTERTSYKVNEPSPDSLFDSIEHFQDNIIMTHSTKLVITPTEDPIPTQPALKVKKIELPPDFDSGQ